MTKQIKSKKQLSMADGHLISKENLDSVAGDRSKEMKEVMLRTWEGLEIKDAPWDIMVNLQDVDLKDSDAKDIFNCALVHAVRRAYDSKHAIFTRSVAYVDIVVNGVRKVYRFTLSLTARKLIALFDTTKKDQRHKLPRGTSFVLNAPSNSHKLDAKRADSKARSKKRTTMLINGQATCRPKSSSTEEKEATAETITSKKKKKFTYGGLLVELSDVRNAAGLVRFKTSVARPSRIKDAI